MDASDAERRRIARDLHDSVVQDLAGTAFSVSAVARNPETAARRARDAWRAPGTSLRTSLKSLRSLLAEIHPPDLHADGPRRRARRPDRTRRRGRDPGVGQRRGRRDRLEREGRAGLAGRPGGGAQRAPALRGLDARRHRATATATARRSRSSTTASGSTRPTSGPGQLRPARPAQPGRRQRRHARGAILTRGRHDRAHGGGSPMTATPIRVVLVDDHAVDPRRARSSCSPAPTTSRWSAPPPNGAEALDGRPRDPARRRTHGPADARGRRRRRHPGDHGRGHSASTCWC